MSKKLNDIKAENKALQEQNALLAKNVGLSEQALDESRDFSNVLRDQANQLLGTVKSVDSATQITLEDNCANVSSVDQLVYNTCPITLVLSFER